MAIGSHIAVLLIVRCRDPPLTATTVVDVSSNQTRNSVLISSPSPIRAPDLPPSETQELRPNSTVTHMETPPCSIYTPSDALSFTTIVSTLPPSYRTWHSEDMRRSPTLPLLPPSSFMNGRRRGQDSSRPGGPRVDSTHARSRSHSCTRIQDLQEDAGQSWSAHYGSDLAGRRARMPVSQNDESGNYPRRILIQESERGNPRKSIDGGVRLAGGPLGTDMNTSSLSLPPYARSSDVV